MPARRVTDPMTSLLFTGLAVAAFALSAWLTRRFIEPDSAFHVLDQPNERSLHDTPVPRTGGVALLLGFLTFLIVAGVVAELPAAAWWIGSAVALLGGVSFVEDRFGLARRYRLLAHLLASLLLVPAALVPEQLFFAERVLSLPTGLALALTLLGTVWMINLYNFMDGMDGFAGGMSLIGFGTLALAGWLHGSIDFALVNALAAAVSGGFLLFNFPAPKARIFMGDAGSTALGFLAAASCLWAARDGILPLWAALLVFSPFIVDASVTLTRRLLRGEKIWQAHRSHYYQRLVQLGWGHRKTVLRAYLLMLVCAAAAIQGADMRGADPAWLLAMCAGVYGMIAYKVHLLESLAENG